MLVEERESGEFLVARVQARDEGCIQPPSKRGTALQLLFSLFCTPRTMLYSTGSNSHGQLAHSETSDTHSYHTIPSLPTTTPTFPPSTSLPSLAFGATHTLALLSPTHLYITGNNARGQLGPGSPQPITNGFQHLPLELLLTALDAVDRAQLGQYDWEIASIAAAWETSFVHLTSRGKGSSRTQDALVSFGANDWGERGKQGQLAQVNCIFFDHLVPQEVPDRRVRIHSVRTGPRHVVALVDLLGCDGSPILVGWGAARLGQLGSSPLPDGKLPRAVPLPTVIPVDVSQPSMTILDYALGREHTVILYSSESSTPAVLLLGSAKQGQLGSSSASATRNLLTSSPSSPSQVYATWTTSFIFSSTSNPPLFGFGTNSHSQLAQPASTLASSSSPVPIPFPSSARISTLATGSEHVLALDEERGDVYAWGWNEHGNLGDETTQDGESVRKVWDAEERGKRATRVWGGNATSWIWVDDDEE